LASLATTSRIFYGLTPGQNYYFKIRIKDKNGNYSDLTQEVSAYTGSATVTNFKAIGDSTFIKLSWNANYQHNCNGFNILRKEENGDYIQIDSWQNNPDLAGNEEGASYTYIDSTCEQGILYTYKLSFDDNEGYQAFYNEEKTAVARYIGKIIVSQSDFLALKDTCYFGYNEMASDGYDTDYDKYKNFNENDTYLYCQLYENNWNTHKTMEKEIKGYYDSSNELKTWVMRIKTNHLNQPTTIRLANYQYRNAQRIFLKRNNDIIDLGNGETYTFVPNSSGFYNFTIFYGNYKPEINIHPITNLLYYPFDPVNFIWEIDNTFSIDHIDLFAVNKHYNIPIQNNLSPDNLMEFQWTIPPIIADSLKLKINLIMTNTQDTLTYLSHYKFGIISPQTSVLTPGGWSLIAQNFYSPDMDYSQIYGENVEFYSWDQNEFYQTDHPEFTLPYWLYAPQDHTETVYNAEVLREATQFTLNQGWNIIPNPYKINFDISQLLFRINSTVYEYYQAVNMHLIETKVFEYNHEFIPVRYLKGGKSYYLYSFYDNIDLIYIPYYNAHNVNEKPTDWEIKITASRNENNQVSSVKILGSTLIQNNVYYPVYDLLKPTAKPIPDTLIFVLNKDFGDGENYYYQLAGNYDPAAETYEKIYTSKIISNSLEDIKFELNEQNLPSDYMVYLKKGEEYMQITPSEPITISPDSELTDLQIVITNFVHLNSQNDVIASVYNVKNYPNPFNPTTTISFYSGSNNQKTTIKIYNLKGQLVTTLLDKKLSAGEHKIIWDGKNKHGKSVSTGVYFYKISFGSDKSIVKKMIMLK
jgi:flagellar hook assembly protein FlgD